MWENLGAALSVLFTILIMVLVLVLAYIATKMLGRSGFGQNPGSGQVKVIDKVYLAQDRALVIVQVAEQAMLVGVTPHHIEKLCDIDADKLEQFHQSPTDTSFSKVLGHVLKDRFGFGKNVGDMKKGQSKHEN